MLALFELAIQSGLPMNARKLAGLHRLPVRFLEIILNELKQGGFVQSIRGKTGGYVLARPAAQITLAEVLQFLDSHSSEPSDAAVSALPNQFVIDSLIRTANQRIAELFEQCTLEQLAEREMQHRNALESNYVI